jgi:DNA-binding GntR family transcriptional regulator
MKNKSVILTENDMYYISNGKDSLTKTVYERLISGFLNNELIPGQMLNRRTLAAEMGVSVAPVLEAMVQLELDGFVESIPRKGTVVKTIKEKDLFERYLLREAFECTAVRLYAGASISAHKKELLEYAALIDQESLYSISRIKMDIIFHASLVNLAGFPLLTHELLRAMRISTFCQMNQATLHSEGYETKMHVDLINKLTTNNIDEAEKTMRDHLWSGLSLSAKYRPES